MATRAPATYSQMHPLSPTKTGRWVGFSDDRVTNVWERGSLKPKQICVFFPEFGWFLKFLGKAGEEKTIK